MGMFYELPYISGFPEIGVASVTFTPAQAREFASNK
jgi:hypothetical protein